MYVTRICFSLAVRHSTVLAGSRLLELLGFPAHHARHLGVRRVSRSE